MIYKYVEEHIFCDVQGFIVFILEAFQDLIAKEQPKVWLKQSDQISAAATTEIARAFVEISSLVTQQLLMLHQVRLH